MSTLPLRRLALMHWTAQAALLIAAFTAARWVFQWEFANFIPGLRDTGIVSATLLLVLGAATGVMSLWPSAHAPSERAAQAIRLVALALAVMPVLMLFEAFSGISLGIDFARASTQPTALHPHPGRISPNACVAYLLLAASLAALAGPVTKAALQRSALLIGAAMLISTLGLLGYLLHVEMLYHWGAFNRMTLPVAVGLALMSVALWQQRQAWSGESHRVDMHEQRITRRAMGVLAVVVIAAGAGGFAALESDFERARAEEIHATTVVAGDAFTATLDAGIWLAETISAQPLVVDQLTRIAASPDDAALRQRLRVMTDSLLTGSLTAARFLDPSGRTLTEAGRFAETRETPTLALSTGYAIATRLFLADGFVLHTERPVVERGEVVGHFVSEQRLVLMDRLVRRIRDSEASADVLICNRVADVAACLPSKLEARPFTVPMFNADGRINLPINRALLGESGVVLTPDLRDVPVVAAFMPLEKTGLALVTKADIEDVFSVIRQSLAGLALLVVALVTAGTWAMRRQVRPLVKQLAASEERMRDVANAIPAIVGAFDAEQRCVFANDLALKVHGLPRDQALGLSLRTGLGEDSYALHRPYVEAVLKGERQSFEGALPWRGGMGYFKINLVPMRDPQTDAVSGFYLMTFDVTELRRAQLEQERSERRLRSIADNLPVLISYVDLEHRLTYANETYKHWMGMDPALVVGTHLKTLIGPELYAQREPHIARALTGERLTFEVVSLALGVTRHLHTVYIPDRHSDGSVQGLYALSTDITEAKKAERLLQDLARNDPLTGLPNRREFESRLTLALARARRDRRVMALVFMDVDHFKAINDGHGHAAGDAVLKEFAHRIQHAVRATDTAARLAGDEFVVILEGLQDAAEASAIAAKLVGVIRLPIGIPGGRALNVTTSIGVACWGGTGKGADDILDRADRALYRAKAAGRDSFAQTTF